MQSKNQIRNELWKKLDAISTHHHQAYSSIICKKMDDWLTKHKPTSIGAFYPVRKEPNIWPVLSNFATTRSLYLPKYIQAHDQYKWALYEGSLTPSQFGIPEPTDIPHPQPTLDACFIPALGIDNNGNRIGWGHGYFDRLLTTHIPHRIGIIFSIQKSITTFPSDPWDIQLTEMLSN